MTKAYQINTNNICVYGHTFSVKLSFKKLYPSKAGQGQCQIEINSQFHHTNTTGD